MATHNDITGDSIQSRSNSKQYADNWGKIFGEKNKSSVKEITEESKNKESKNENL